MRRLAIIAALFLAFPTLAVEVQQEVWGFDGHAVLGEFNPLSVYVYNPDDKPFEGVVTLRKDDGVRALGARLVEPCYLAPETGRWVTFYPYITSEHHEWNVSWGRGRDKRKELGAPAVGDPAAVYLLTNRIARPPGSLRGFEAGRFPVTVGATGGLRAVVLDSTPDWDPPRRKAFMDWLHTGGELHILSNPGAEPKFTGELAMLDVQLPTFRIGAGRVYRHGFTRADLTDAKLRELGLTPRNPSDNGNPGSSVIEQSISQSLQGIVRPEHNWALIYFASVAFLLIVGPINGFLSRKRLGHRGSLLVVCAAVGAFSFGFYSIGRRGYGESTITHKIAYARPLADGWDVTQYANVFVTRGDLYRITHHAQHNLYATAQNHEPVRGDIITGGGGAFQVDIPIYSWRSYIHRATFGVKPFTVEIEKWPTGSGPEGLVVRVGEGFPANTGLIWALRSDTIGYAFRGEGQLSVTATGGRYSDVLRLKEHRQNAGYIQQNSYYNPYALPTKPDADKTISQFVEPLVAAKLGVLRADADQPLTDPDHIILFIYAPAPKEFSAQAEAFAVDHGFVIYQIDLFKENE